MGVEETGFCEGGHKLSCPLMRVPVRRASAVLILPFLSFLQTVLSSHQCVFCKELGLCFASSSTELLLTGSVCWWFQGIKTFVFVVLIEVTFVDHVNTAVCQLQMLLSESSECIASKVFYTKVTHDYTKPWQLSCH